MLRSEGWLRRQIGGATVAAVVVGVACSPASQQAQPPLVGPSNTAASASPPEPPPPPPKPKWKPDPELAALLRELRAPDAFEPHASGNGGRFSDAYTQARDELLIRAARPKSPDGFIAALATLVRTIDHDSFLGRSIVEVLPDDDTLLRFVAAAGRQGLQAGKHVIISVIAALARLRQTRAPEALPVLLEYLGYRRTLPESYSQLDTAFEILREGFAAQPAFIEFLWQHVPGPSNSSWGQMRHRQVVELLSAYQGEGADGLLVAALASPVAEARALALRLALARESLPKAARAPLVAALRSQALAELRQRRWAEKELRHLRELARTDAQAFGALLDLVFETHSHRACRQAEEVLAAGEQQLNPAQWRRLLTLMKDKPVVHEAFALAGKADMGGVQREVLAMLQSSSGSHLNYLGQAIAEQRSVKALSYVLRGMKPFAAKKKLTVLQSLRRQYRNQSWGRDVIPLLRDTDQQVAQAAYRVLGRSSDPVVQRGLGSLSQSTLSSIAAGLPFDAVSEGLRVSWQLPSNTVSAGQPLVANVTLQNDGYLPIQLPPAVPSHSWRWHLVVGGQATLGPLALSLPAQPTELRRHDSVVLQLSLGSALAALGPGAHPLRLAYSSRSMSRHWPQHRDFSKTSGEQTLTVQAFALAQTPAAVRAAINSPDSKRRAPGWRRFAATWRRVAASKTPANAALQKLVGGAAPPQTMSFEMRLRGGGIRTLRYVVERRPGKGLQFIWSWDEEDIGGRSELPLQPAEARQFFRLLLQGSPFSHRPVQIYGSVHEAKAMIRLISGGQSFAAPALWAAEAEQHPATRRWFALLKKWEARAKQRSKRPRARP